MSTIAFHSWQSAEQTSSSSHVFILSLGVTLSRRCCWFRLPVISKRVSHLLFGVPRTCPLLHACSASAPLGNCFYLPGSHSSQDKVSSVPSLSRVRLFATPWMAARQASLSITNSWTLLKVMSIESVMPPNHLILCCPLLLPPSIFPSIRVFSSDSVLHTRWPNDWSFPFSISPSDEYSGQFGTYKYQYRFQFCFVLSVFFLLPKPAIFGDKPDFFPSLC